MAKDIQDTVRDLIVGAIENAGKGTPSAKAGRSGRGLSGLRGVAAGAGAAALAPVAVKGAGKLVRDMGFNGVRDVLRSPGKAVQGLASDAGEHLGSQLGDKVSEKVDESGGPAGILKAALPFGDGGDATKGGGLGVGRGRRMPVQQSIDIGVPLETVYNQWTQFEDWPHFMHRVTRVTQEDDTTVSFAVKIWGKTKEFTAEIETQRPDERVKWRVTQGMTHAGVMTFHELGPSLTRVLLGLDVQPGGVVEKAARGLRHVKRAARGDLHRFKAFVEMQERETGAWRGVIEDGEVTEEHDPAYDEEREYSDPEAFDEDAGDGADEDDDAEDEAPEDDEDAEQPRSRSSRGQRRSSANGHGADDEPDTPARSRPSPRRSSRGRSGGDGSGARSGSGGSGRRSRSRGASS
jgi:uncharacterized membrane protein